VNRINPTAIQPGLVAPPTRASTVLDLAPSATLAARLRLAIVDLRGAWHFRNLAATLAWTDIKLRYRGSVLGPFWLTLSTALMVASMGTIYATLFRMTLRTYLPFLALSLVLWNFLSTLITEACATYTTAETTIRGQRLPFITHALRVVMRNFLVLAHNVVVIVAVYLIFRIWPGVTGLLVLPGIALWLVDALAVTLLLGGLCARFRDIPPIVGSLMQMAFFVTPVIWRPDLVGPKWSWLLPFNPFYSLLEVVRGPLLGDAPSGAIWLSAVLSSLLLVLLGAWLFTRTRARIAFWV
jgi:lipopolysaccharide transport system permease protein